MRICALQRPDCRSRSTARANNRDGGITQTPETFQQRFDEAGGVRVVPEQSIILDDHGVHSSNLFCIRIDPVETLHHCLLVRSSYAQSTQVPAQLARSWVDHTFAELLSVLDFKRQVDAVHIF